MPGPLELSVALGPYQPVRVTVTPQANVIMEVTTNEGILFLGFSPTNAELVVRDLERAIATARRIVEAN